MDERGEDVTAQQAPRPTRRQVRARRMVGALVLVGLLGAGAWAGASLVRSEDRPPPPPTTTLQTLARLRVIFPEGFTRAEMADRVAAVREIAIQKRGVTPRLTRGAYLGASAHARLPAAFRKYSPSSREGFLFPATYDFTQLTTAAQLVRD